MGADFCVAAFCPDSTTTTTVKYHVVADGTSIPPPSSVAPAPTVFKLPGPFNLLDEWMPSVPVTRTDLTRSADQSRINDATLYIDSGRY